VQLIDPITKLVIATTITDPQGNYTFVGVAPGSYDVRAVAPPGTTATTIAVQRVAVLPGAASVVPLIGFAAIEPIPTLSTWLTLLLALMMALAAAARLLRSQRRVLRAAQ
jgi:SdrD B-like domain